MGIWSWKIFCRPIRSPHSTRPSTATETKFGFGRSEVVRRRDDRWRFPQQSRSRVAEILQGATRLGIARHALGQHPDRLVVWFREQHGQVGAQRIHIGSAICRPKALTANLGRHRIVPLILWSAGSCHRDVYVSCLNRGLRRLKDCTDYPATLHNRFVPRTTCTLRTTCGPPILHPLPHLQRCICYTPSPHLRPQSAFNLRNPCNPRFRQVTYTLRTTCKIQFFPHSQTESCQSEDDFVSSIWGIACLIKMRKRSIDSRLRRWR